MYAKLINANLKIAPNPIIHNGLWYGNPPGPVYEAEGYKQVQYTNKDYNIYKPGLVPGDWSEVA